VFFKFQSDIFFLLFAFLEIRSGWSFVEDNMQADTGFSDGEVGVINMMFLLFLGVGFEINGHLGDKKDPKWFLIGGMLLGSVSLLFMGVARLLMGSKNIYWIVCMQALNGFFESACIPSFFRIIANWFS